MGRQLRVAFDVVVEEAQMGGADAGSKEKPVVKAVFLLPVQRFPPGQRDRVVIGIGASPRTVQFPDAGIAFPEEVAETRLHRGRVILIARLIIEADRCHVPLPVEAGDQVAEIGPAEGAVVGVDDRSAQKAMPGEPLFRIGAAPFRVLLQQERRRVGSDEHINRDSVMREPPQ